MNKGLYVHIPFCISKCKYCDFVSFTSCEYEAYIDALCRELDIYKGEQIDTIFIGGGTPTVLSIKLLEKLLTDISSTFLLAENTEWTVEANPKTADAEKLRLMRSLGVNRISLGVQSFNDNELRKIGRIHNSSEAKEALSLIAESFDNFNIDLISALPEQTKESFLSSLKTATEFSPTHISCYSLILEEGTQLYNENAVNPLKLPDEETEREMYDEAVCVLESRGYERYEISNFSKTEFECKHNLKYWHCDDYIGAGVAAHSLLNGVRYSNTSDLTEYINGIRCIEETKLSEEDMISEFIIMTLRLSEGLDEKEFVRRFSGSFYKAYKPVVDKFLSFGFMEKTKAGYRLTDKGISVSNSILCEFV